MHSLERPEPQEVAAARGGRSGARPAADTRAGQAWAREVLGALDTLEARTATAVRLIYLGQATPAQAAVHLGLPEAEITRTVADGLRQLAARLFPAPPPRLPADRDAPSPPTGIGSRTPR